MSNEPLHILVADDDEGDRMLVIRSIRWAGVPCACTETTTIEEALAECEHTSFDCAIVDYRLPGVDGLEGITALHQRNPAMPIVMVTGKGDAIIATEAMKRGASDYLPKNLITPESIERAVDNAIQKAKLQQTISQQQTELFRLADERHHAELALRDNFLSHVSHELRAPLACIASFSSILADGLAGEINEQQSDYLQIVLKNSRQLAAMIEDLLTVRSLQTGKLRVVLERASLREAIHDAMDTCRAHARAKGVTLSASVPEQLTWANADPVRLVQVLLILCDNAIKFTPAGGSVEVSARVLERDADFLVASIADTGRGIPREHTSRIFEHLYQITDTLDAGRQGLGLGLHIARELVAAQGGRIWVESQLDRGSTFSFSVPVYDASSTRAEKQVETLAQA